MVANEAIVWRSSVTPADASVFRDLGHFPYSPEVLEVIEKIRTDLDKQGYNRSLLVAALPV